MQSTWDERRVAARAVDVDRAREQAFARAGLAVEQHGRVGLGRAHDHLVDRGHGGRAADHVVETAAHGHAALRVVAAQRRVVERAADLLGEHAREIFVARIERAVVLVEDLQHTAHLPRRTIGAARIDVVL